MATLTVNQITDLMNSTLADLGRDHIQNVAQTYVDYPAVNLFLKNGSQGAKMLIDDGSQIQRNVQIRKYAVARFKGVMQTDTVNREDVTVQAQIPWRFADAHWTFTEQDIYLNRGKSKIFNLIKSQRANAHMDMMDLLEAALWTSPAASDSKSPYGVPYYIVKASGTPAFQGGHPSGHSAVANISRTTYANWKNYTGQYTAVSKADLLKKCRTAFDVCRFRDLEGLNLQDYRKGRDRYALFVNQTTKSTLEDIGEAQNENLGRDLAVMEVQTGMKDIYRMDGALTFRRKPIIYAPKLDEDTSNPVYGLDLSTWCAYVHRDFNMKERETREISDQHGTFVVWLDLWFNLMCVDPRRNFVFYV